MESRTQRPIIVSESARAEARRRAKGVWVRGTARSDTDGLLLQAGGGVPGEGQEDVVQGRVVHGEPAYRAAVRVDLVEDRPDVRRGAVGRHADDEPGRVGVDAPVAQVAGDLVEGGGVVQG